MAKSYHYRGSTYLFADDDVPPGAVLKAPEEPKAKARAPRNKAAAKPANKAAKPETKTAPPASDAPEPDDSEW